MRLRPRRLAPLLCLFALAALPAGAVAEPRVALSRGAAEAGERVRLAGHGFERRAPVRVRVGGTLVRRTRTGPRGGYRVRLVVPDKRPGRYRVIARSGRRFATRVFRIRATPPAPTLVAAGDIACAPGWTETATACGHGRTANLVEALSPDAVAGLGDNQYAHGELENFTTSFAPTWGRFKALIRPAVGNHEYEGDPERDSADGYYDYFGPAAGDRNKGYYRWSLGDWTVFVLNSGAIEYTRAVNSNLGDDCWPVSCAVGSPQEQWLRAELESLSEHACVLAYWHHPRFSSGYGGSWRDYPETAPIWDALYDHGAELALVGHSHNYERFEPMDSLGTPDATNGITEFVVGTGGRSLFPSTGPERDESEAFFSDTFGVLELELSPGAWSSRFVAETGLERDASTGTCHARPSS